MVPRASVDAVDVSVGSNRRPNPVESVPPPSSIKLTLFPFAFVPEMRTFQLMYEAGTSFPITSELE